MKYVYLFITGLFAFEFYPNCRAIFSKDQKDFYLEMNYVMAARTPACGEVKDLKNYVDRHVGDKKYTENIICALMSILRYTNEKCLLKKYDNIDNDAKYYLRKIFLNIPEKRKILIYSTFFDECKKRGFEYSRDEEYDKSRGIIDEMWKLYLDYMYHYDVWEKWLKSNKNIENPKVSKRASKSVKRGSNSVTNTSLKRTKKGK